MPRKRTPKPTTSEQIPLAHPDRNADPSKETLISWAESRDLFKEPASKTKAEAKTPSSRNDQDEEEDEEYQVGRFAESILWSFSLATVHFTLDFVVQHQYAQEMEVWKLVVRSLQAFPVILIFFYTLHQHPKPSILPGFFPITAGSQDDFHMVLFFMGAVAAGCYLIHITNMYPYYAVMKQSAPVGCVWIWSVVELSLVPAVLSLLCCLVFLFWGNYSFL